MKAHARSPYLITAAELALHIQAGDPISILDVRWQLGVPDGRPAYLDGHLPGAAASRCRCKRQGQFRSAVSIRASGSAAGRFAGWGLYGPVVVRAPAMFGL